jgi:hypothetical protein
VLLGLNAIVDVIEDAGYNKRNATPPWAQNTDGARGFSLR